MHIYDMIVILVFTSSENVFYLYNYVLETNIGDFAVSIIDIYVYINIGSGYDYMIFT